MNKFLLFAFLSSFIFLTACDKNSAPQPVPPIQEPSEPAEPTVPEPTEPEPAAWPDETNTGVKPGITLTTVNSDVKLSTPNQVYENKEVNGCIQVTAKNVTIRNVIVKCKGWWGISSDELPEGFNLLIEDTEIVCVASGTGCRGKSGITGRNTTVLRTNIHGWENGIDAEKNFILRDSYIHDLYTDSEAHSDGYQVAYAPEFSNLIIEHNTILAGKNTTSSFIASGTNDLAKESHKVFINNNLFGGGAYTVYCPRSHINKSEWLVTNNHFTTRFYPKSGAYGPLDNCKTGAGITVSGNVWHESGELVK